MRYLLLATVLLFSGCANQNMLLRCQQLEMQRDNATQYAQECAVQNKILAEYLEACIMLYKECDDKIISH